MKKKRNDQLDYIRKHLPDGIWIYSYRGKVILKFPYSRDHNGHRLRKYNTVCAIPTNRQERKDAKEMVLDLARMRAKEFFEHDKFGIEPDWMKQKIPSFDGLAEDYIEKHSIPPAKSIRDCMNEFKNKRLDDITAEQIKDFYVKLLKTPTTLCSHGKTFEMKETLSLSSVKQRKMFITKVFRFAKDKGLIQTNVALDAQIPMDEVKKLGKEKEDRQKAISPEDFLVIHSKIDPSTELWVTSLISFMTGMRAGEIYGLEAEIVNINHRYPYINLDKQHVSRGPARIVPLMPPLVEILEPLCKDRIGRIFRTRFYNQTWNRAVEDSKITHHKGNFRFHDLRSTFITMAKDAKMAVEDRMKITGHTVPDDEEIVMSKIHLAYYDPLKERLHKAIILLDDYLESRDFWKKVVNQ